MKNLPDKQVGFIFITKIAETRVVLKEGGEPGERTTFGIAVVREISIFYRLLSLNYVSLKCNLFCFIRVI